MRTVARSGLIDQIITLLSDEIHNGRWQVGEKIPNETELAGLTGASRNTVREAVQALVHAGMLERRQGSGTYVISASDFGGALDRCFSRAELYDILELRLALETTAARLAARRRTPADVEQLRKLLADQESFVGSDDHELAAHSVVALRRGIVAAGHNAVYLQVYDSLMPTLIAQSKQWFDKGKSLPHGARYQALVETVIAGKDEAAFQIMSDILTALLDDEQAIAAGEHPRANAAARA